MAKVVMKRISEVLRKAQPKDLAFPSDSELLERFRKSRDEEAFSLLVQRHGRTVLAACRQVLSDPADIDDAFQASFLVLVQKISRLSNGAIGSWLYAVAHQIAVRINWDSRRRAQQEGAAAKQQRFESHPTDPSWREAVAILHEELDRLPDTYRRVLLLCYLTGQSREEAALNLGWTQGTVKGRLERGRKLLAKRLTNRGITLSVALLAVVTGNTTGVDFPRQRLIELTFQAMSGTTSPTVNALVQGAFPMARMAKKTLACLVAFTGLVAIASLGDADSPADLPAKTETTPRVGNSKGDNPTPKAPEKKHEEQHSITGIIKDTSGAPIASATVLAMYDFKTGAWRTTTTDDKGRFLFDRIPPDLHQSPIIAAKEGFAAVEGYSLLKDNHKTELTLPEASACSGTVKDEKGVPIAGAEILFGTVDRHEGGMRWGYGWGSNTRGTDLEKFYFTRTDTKGEFRFTSVPAGAELIFRAKAVGFAETDTSGTSPKSPIQGFKAGPNGKPAQIVMAPEAIVSGQITSKVPAVKIEGLSVRLTGIAFPTGLGQEVKADKEGRFTFKGLPAGEVSLTIDFPAGTKATTQGKVVPTKSGETSAVNMEVIEGVEVSGIVRVKGTGRPREGVTVAVADVVSPKTPEVASAQSDSAGRFVFRLPPGEGKFYVQVSPGFTCPNANNRNTLKVTIPNDVKTYTIPEPFELVPLKDTLFGRVTDAAGMTIPHAKILLLQHTVCFYTTEPVAASYDGQFALQIPEGITLEPGSSVSLRVELSDGRRFETNAIYGKEGISEVRLPTLPEVKGPHDVKADEFAGIVVDENGKTLEGVKVHMRDYCTSPNSYVSTGTDGSFRIKNCDNARQVPVRFSKDGYSPVLVVRQQVGVKGLVIAMNRSTYFEGVVRGPDGKPVAGAVIQADQGPKMLDGAWMPEMLTETKSDAQGWYRFYVCPDDYVLSVKVAGVGVARLPKTGIAHGQARMADIQLQAGVTFRARVIDSVTSKPVVGVRVYKWQQKDVDAKSDEHGEVTFAEMLPGEMTFHIETEQHMRWWSDRAMKDFERKSIADTRIGWQRNFDWLTFDLKRGMEPVTIVVEKAVRITGQVFDPNGKPVSEATVAPVLTNTGNSLGGDTRFSAMTEADGTFAMSLPASGAAEYNLVAHDGKFGQWRNWANGVLPPIKTTPGQTIEGVTLRLTLPAVVRGKVVDENGKPVANRDVRAAATDPLESRHYDPTTRTKADGTFELRHVRAGEHRVQVAPFSFEAKDAPAKTTQTIKVREGQTQEGIVLIAVDEQAK